MAGDDASPAMSSPTPKIEDNVNQRAGHIAVGHRGRALVWGGYMENQENNDQYWSSSEIWVYNGLTQTWTSRRTQGDVPSKCSGAAACVLDDSMFVVAGFHRIIISLKSLREKGGPLDQLMDSSEEEDEDEEVFSVEISHNIWTLDLNSWMWTKLEPAGDPPLRCDKTACWSHGDRVFLFGGFGPPPSASHADKLGALFSFVVDPTTTQGYGGYTRGWSNQLVAYNTVTDRWEWPMCSGVPPSPRAAHSVCVVGDTAYVFGGRHMDQRLNDLHALDLVNLTWSLVVADTGDAEGLEKIMPLGRSWQTMTSLHTGHPEGGLLLYGGFDNSLTALGDCWRMDLRKSPVNWVRCSHLESGPRLWHASVCLDPSQVMVVGGLTNNILAPSYVIKHHAEKTLFLRVAPPSLLKICLEYIGKNPGLYRDTVEDLPHTLKKIVQIRCSSSSGA